MAASSNDSAPVDLWTELFAEHESLRRSSGRGIDLVLHLGDQVYSDPGDGPGWFAAGEKTPYLRAMDLARAALAKRSKVDEGTKQAIRQIYRDVYRDTWNRASVAAVLASCSNLMVNDDHEFYDNYGQSHVDADPKSAEFRVGIEAFRVLCEFQRALFEDFHVPGRPDLEGVITATNASTDALIARARAGLHHAHSFGDLGVLFVESRVARAIGKTAKNTGAPMLGAAQWASVTAALGSGGILESVSVLVVATAVPLVFLGRPVTATARRAVADVAGHWATAEAAPEQNRLFRELAAWRQRGPGGQGARDFMVVAGDVHVGGFTRITLHDGSKCEQMTSSAICNETLGPVAYNITRAGQGLEWAGDGGIKFDHLEWVRERNFGRLTLERKRDVLELRARLVVAPVSKSWIGCLCCCLGHVRDHSRAQRERVLASVKARK
jgi:hypothetical protein